MTHEDQSDAILQNLGLRLAELRHERSWTQEQMAENAGVTSQYLQRVEAGKENLTVRSLAKLASLFDVGIADLFTLPTNRERRPGRPRRTT